MIANEPEGMPCAGPTRKLFFALWPDAPRRAALAALQAPVAGRLTPPAKLHLTLAFLGHVAAGAVPALLAIRDRLAVPPLHLIVDCYGYFARPRIAWAGMTQVPDGLVALHAALVRDLEEAGFSATVHGAFRPHVTLARDARQAPPDAPAAPVAWPVERVVLVESLPDGRYLPLEY